MRPRKKPLRRAAASVQHRRPAERQHCDAELGHGSTERGSQAICCCYMQLLMQLRAQRVLLATKGVAAAPAAVPPPLPGGGAGGTSPG